MSEPLYPAPRLVIYGRRFLVVSIGKTRPLADLRYYAPRYTSEQMPIIVDGKFGWLRHDAETGYRIVVGKLPVPTISVRVRDGRPILSLKDEHGRLTFWGEREAGSGTFRAITYTGFAADGAGESVATMYEEHSAMRVIERILAPLDFSRPAAALERAA